MGYVREAGMSTAARRKRRRTALVISSLLMIVVVGFLIAVATMQGWLNFGDEDGTTDDVAITSSAPAPLAPSDITINVYNSTAEYVENTIMGPFTSALGELGIPFSADYTELGYRDHYDMYM